MLEDPSARRTKSYNEFRPKPSSSFRHRRALTFRPNDAASLDSRGLTYLKMGQFDSAIEDYSSALRIEPKMASALYGRGLARLKKGDAAGGNADVAAAKQVEARIADDFSHYGIR